MEIHKTLKLSKCMNEYPKAVYEQIVGKESSLNFSITLVWSSLKLIGVLVTTTTTTNLSFEYLLSYEKKASIINVLQSRLYGTQ